MRLYSFRFFPDDGRLRSCLRTGDEIQVFKSRKRDAGGRARMESVQPYQGSTFVIINGGIDRVNVIQLSTISGYIFCTPRCYTTKSWEVGICNSYLVKYLCGGNSLTSFDLHIILVMETIQVYLQQMEIREQSVGYFYLPDNLQRHMPLPRVLKEVPSPCRKLWCLLRSICQDGKEMQMSVTAQIAQLNIVRREYFQDLHLDPSLTRGSAHRSFLKMVGFMYGRIVGQLKNIGVVLRQYFGQCPIQEQV